MKPDETKRADIVHINHTCDICHQTKDEPYDLFNRNNPRHLQKFTSVCNYCTRKKFLQGQWVGMKVVRYKGMFGPIGRAWTALLAGIEFERVWTSTGEFGVKGQMRSLQLANELNKRVDIWPKTWQQECRDKMTERLMGNKIVDSAALLQIIIDATHGTTDKATLQQLPSEGFGEYKIIWDGSLIKITLEKFKRARYYVDNVEVDSLGLDAILQNSQKFSVFNSTCLVEFNGAWTLKAQFNSDMALWAAGTVTQIIVKSPGADSLVGAVWSTKEDYQVALDKIKDGPEEPFGGKVPGSPDETEGDLAYRPQATHEEDIGALASLITTGIDGAAGRDYSVLMEYRRVGDVSKATVQIDVTNVQVVTAKLDTAEVRAEIERLAEKYAVPDASKAVEEVVKITTGPGVVMDHTHKSLADVAADSRKGFGEGFDPEAKQSDGGEADLERTEWSAADALRFYAEQRHFDVVDGRTRILCTGAIASHALKGLDAEYAAHKSLTDVADDVLAVGYDSEFDKTMNAVYDVVQTGQLAELSPDLLRGPEWNRFYAAVRAMRKANHTTGQ